MRARWPLSVAAVVVGATFAIDLWLPRGFAGAVPYVLAVALGLWVPSPRYSLGAAVLCSALIVVGAFLKAPGASTAVVVGNRIFALVGVWSVAVAVTKYIVTSRAASETAARHRAILATSVDGFVSIDEAGRVETFNAAAERMFGWPAAEVLGCNVSMLMPSPDREAHDGYLRRYLSTGVARVIGVGREMLGQRRDGSTFPIEIGIAEVPLEDRRVFTASVRDITERRRTEREREDLIHRLEGKNAELERFTYAVSHDLKSPLVTIKGFLGMALQAIDRGNAERARSDLGRIAAAADRMRRLLDELLELSRVGRVTHPSSDVPLAELVREAAELLAGPLAQRGVTLVVPPDLPVVRCDRVRLLEVVQNLLENAIKFMGDQVSPRVAVGCRRDGEETTLFVEDNGVGIEPRYHDKVFGLFEKLDREGSGTGVGLALVRRIIEAHGGRVWIESEGLGAGTRVCFTLPEPAATGSNEA